MLPTNHQRNRTPKHQQPNRLPSRSAAVPDDPKSLPDQPYQPFQLYQNHAYRVPPLTLPLTLPYQPNQDTRQHVA